MLLSIANATPRNIEAVRTSDLLPFGIQSNAKTLVELLEYYYAYLNTSGLPSAEIGSINSLKDIDLVSQKYLDQIEELIGKSIPNSKVLNRIELYKIIVRYYNTRGSEESIHTFFKIFFDEVVKIIYPKERLFDLSNGKGAWSSQKLIDESPYKVYTRNKSDESTLVLGGITYDAVANDGGGQLVSIRYKAADVDSYEVVADYVNGVTTVTPGAKARLLISSTVLSDGFVTYPIASELYFSGFGIDGKPTYSERIDNINPFVGTPTRVEWDGEQWELTIGSLTGDLFAFYSEETVDDPSLVTTWLYGWTSLIIPITGSINSITFGPAVNAQIFDALLNTTGFATDVLISADVLAAEWLTTYEITPRKYLTSFDLPVDVNVGTLAVMNGGVYRPFVLGRATIIDGDIVWQRYLTEVWEYENHRSFASDEYKIFDGYYWQDYSYVIRSDIDSIVWFDEYRKFVHPAGLKMFAAIAIEIVSRNEWFNELDYTSEDLNTDDTWMQAFIPPYIRNSSSIGFHTPKYQPGYLRERIMRYIFKYLIPGNHDTELLRLVIMMFKFVFGPTDVRTSFIRRQYQGSEKFIDPCQIGDGWLSKTIVDAEEPFSNTNRCKIYNISPFIKQHMSIFDYSFYDEAGGDGSGVWAGSSYDEAGGDGSGVWAGSSYENL
jgi:hypothetical protein